MSYLANVTSVAYVKSEGNTTCVECGEELNPVTDDFSAATNHYLNHGYLLLHVGMEAGRTVAVLGAGAQPLRAE